MTPTSTLDEEQEVDLSSGWQRLKLRWWLPVGGLVVGRRRDRARAVRRLGLARADDRLPRPAVRAARRRPDPEPRHEPAHGRGDHPLRGGAEERVRRERHPRVAAPLGHLDARAPRRRAAARHQPAHGDHRQGLGQAQGRAGRGRARRPGHRARLRLRDGEGRAPRGAGEVGGDAARGGERTYPLRAGATGGDPRRPLDPAVEQRLLVTANLNSVVTTADARRAAIQDETAEASQLLNLAESVESSRVVEPAAASKTTARSSRSSLLVGALIGLIVGAIAALVVDPIAGRRRGTAAPASS